MPKSNYSVIIPKNVIPKPNMREMSASYILLNYFKSNIEFIPRNNYKTPDLFIDGIEWEIKAPTGQGKRNLQHTVSRALKQSQYIIIDARFSKIHIAKIRNYLSSEIQKNKRIKRLLLIDKQKKVLEIRR